MNGRTARRLRRKVYAEIVDIRKAAPTKSMFKHIYRRAKKQYTRGGRLL